MSGAGALLLFETFANWAPLGRLFSKNEGKAKPLSFGRYWETINQLGFNLRLKLSPEFALSAVGTVLLLVASINIAIAASERPTGGRRLETLAWASSISSLGQIAAGFNVGITAAYLTGAPRAERASALATAGLTLLTVVLAATIRQWVDEARELSQQHALSKAAVAENALSKQLRGPLVPPDASSLPGVPVNSWRLRASYFATLILPPLLVVVLGVAGAALKRSQTRAAWHAHWMEAVLGVMLLCIVLMLFISLPLVLGATTVASRRALGRRWQVHVTQAFCLLWIGLWLTLMNGLYWGLPAIEATAVALPGSTALLFYGVLVFTRRGLFFFRLCVLHQAVRQLRSEVELLRKSLNLQGRHRARQLEIARN